MENCFNGKSVLVTGAGSGIGAATAELFASRGASVLVVDRDADACATEVDRLLSQGVTAAPCVADVSDSAACDRAVDTAVHHFGRLDILVNNAGGGKLCPALELSDEDWRHMQAINTDGTFYMSRAALRVMVAQSSGAIVNVASVHGQVGFNNHIGYTAAKAVTRGVRVKYRAY